MSRATNPFEAEVFRKLALAFGGIETPGWDPLEYLAEWSARVERGSGGGPD